MGKRLSALLPPSPGRATRPCILHAAWGEFVGLNGSKFSRVRGGGSQALECGAYDFRRQTPRPRAT